MYVDDIRVWSEVCTGLFGPDAVAKEIDLNLGRVSIARKNFLNTLNGFLYVHLYQPIDVKTALL